VGLRCGEVNTIRRTHPEILHVGVFETEPDEARLLVGRCILSHDDPIRCHWLWISFVAGADVVICKTLDDFQKESTMCERGEFVNDFEC